MQLYYFPNTIAVAAALALEEAGTPYTPVHVDCANGAQNTPDYLAINPKARVPALAADGAILTEVGAILEWIGAKAPKLVPQDTWAQAQMRSLMYYCASTMHVNHAHKKRGYRWADQDASKADMTAKVPETMGASAEFIESQMQGPFLAGAQLTLADCYLYPLCHWLPEDGVDLAATPKLATWKTTMDSRPSIGSLRQKGILT